MSNGNTSSRRTRPRIGKKTDQGRPLFETEEYDQIPVTAQGAIRILKVDPAEFDQPAVYCELIPGTIVADKDYLLGENARTRFRAYDALSWCWGRGAANDSIFIRKDDLTFVKHVQQDLVRALRALRHKTETRYLWVDAVCINQQYGPEKNRQVEMMAEIYGRADCVRVWLGDSDPSSDLAILFIKEQILQLQHFDDLTRSPDNSSKWEALLKLMQRDWFSRRWVVQELTLAQRSMIHCGRAKIAWRKFAIAVELFVEVESATHRLSEVMKTDSKYQHIPREFEHISHLGASLLVDATGKLFRSYDYLEPGKPRTSKQATISPLLSKADLVLQYDSEDEEDPGDHDDGDDMALRLKGQPLLTLEYLVSSMSIFDVSNPHDSIYALLGISKDTTPTAVNKQLRVTDHTQAALEMFTAKKQYSVNYEANYIDICQEFIQFCVRQNVKRDPSRALDVICRPWAVEPESQDTASNFPSWLPRLDRAAYGMDRAPGIGGMRMGRKNADSLVGLPNVTHRNYNAAETISLDMKTFRFRKRIGDTQDLSKSTDSVSTTSPPAEQSPSNSERVRSIITANDSTSASPGSKQQDSPLFGTNRIAENNAASPRAVNGVNTSTTSATNLTPAVNRATQGLLIDHFSLYVKGFVLDTITAVQTASQSGSIPTAWAEFAGWDMKGTPPEFFWRTLVADRGSNGKNPPVYYAKACEESFRKGGKISGVVETAGLIEYERNSVVAQFCRRVQSAVWNRALVRTKSGRLGLVSQGVREGDVICIFYGCSVPVVLRRQGPKPPEVVQWEMTDELRHVVKQVVRSYRTHLSRREVFRKKREDDKLEYRKWEEEKLRKEWRKDDAWRDHWQLVRNGLVRVHEFRAWYLKTGPSTPEQEKLARGLVKVLLSQMDQIAVEASKLPIKAKATASKPKDGSDLPYNIVDHSMQPATSNVLKFFTPTNEQVALWTTFREDHQLASKWKEEKERHFKEKGFIAWARQEPKTRKYGYLEDRARSMAEWKRPLHQEWTETWAAENSWFLCIDSFRAWIRAKAKWYGSEEDVTEKQEWERDGDWHRLVKPDEGSFENWQRLRNQWKDDSRWHEAGSLTDRTFVAWRKSNQGSDGHPQSQSRPVDPERVAHDSWLQRWQVDNANSSYAEECEAWRLEWKRLQAERSQQAKDQAAKLEQNADKKDNERFVERWRRQYRPPVVDWTEFQLALSYGRHWLKIVRRYKKELIGEEEHKRRHRKAVKTRQKQRRSRVRNQFGYDAPTKNESAQKHPEQTNGHNGNVAATLQGSIADHSEERLATTGVTDALAQPSPQPSEHGKAPLAAHEPANQAKGSGDITKRDQGRRSSNKEVAGDADNVGSPQLPHRANTRESFTTGFVGKLSRVQTGVTENDPAEQQKWKWENDFEAFQDKIWSRGKKDYWIDFKKQNHGVLWGKSVAAVEAQFAKWEKTRPTILFKENIFRRDYARPKLSDGLGKNWGRKVVEQDAETMRKRQEKLENELPLGSRHRHFFAYKERSRLSPLGQQRYMSKVEEKFQKKSGQDAEWWYQMMGECYVHGMMDGEAMRHQNDEGIVARVFEIR